MVVVAVEDITTMMRDMVRIVVRVVVKGMGGRLMNGGGTENRMMCQLPLVWREIASGANSLSKFAGARHRS